MDEKTEYQANIFSSRLIKQYRHLRKWARNNAITAYRLYDRDIPEVPLLCDLYIFMPNYVHTKEDAAQFLDSAQKAISTNDSAYIIEEKERTYLRIYLYERPYQKDATEEATWLTAMAQAAAKALGIQEEHIVTKMRHRQEGNAEGRTSQYEKEFRTKRITGLVYEAGLLFSINLTDYIDTGLFFDHRPLRTTVRSQSYGKSVLNLFCYTGSFSVFAAAGGASYVESVDLSNTYLNIAHTNMQQNGFTDNSKYVYTKCDVQKFLSQRNKERYDIIILDPPTFSNSKSSDLTLDINKDWATLVKSTLLCLKPGGILYFSTNSRKLRFEKSRIALNEKRFTVEELGETTIPEDCKSKRLAPPHRAWRLTFLG